MRFQQARYPLNGRSSILEIYSTICFAIFQYAREKKLNRLFPLIKVAYCLKAKTRKIVVLFNNADDCSKVLSEWHDTCFEKPTRTFFGEASKKLIGIFKDVPKEITAKQLKNDLISKTVKRYQKDSQPFLVIDLTFDPDSEYQLGVSHGKYLSNMHFKVEPKSSKM